jgi:hypothetical protein
LLGYDSDFDLALLDVENSVRRITLRKNDLLLLMCGNGAALCDRFQKNRRLKSVSVRLKEGMPRFLISAPMQYETMRQSGRGRLYKTAHLHPVMELDIYEFLAAASLGGGNVTQHIPCEAGCLRHVQQDE